jgi:hypothetical protein
MRFFVWIARKIFPDGRNRVNEHLLPRSFFPVDSMATSKPAADGPADYVFLMVERARRDLAVAVLTLRSRRFWRWPLGIAAVARSFYRLRAVTALADSILARQRALEAAVSYAAPRSAVSEACGRDEAHGERGGPQP